MIRESMFLCLQHKIIYMPKLFGELPLKSFQRDTRF